MKYKGYYSLREIEDKFGKSRHTVRSWLRKGWLKATTGKNPYHKNELYISESDWFDMPTFMRKSRS